MIRFVIPLCLFMLLENTLTLEKGVNLVTLREINGRIINGKNATLGQFPWQVALVLNLNNSIGFCGGSIIGEEWILTAGHCIERAIEVTVVIGTVDMNSISEVVVASKFILHEEYNASTLANDIGLINLPVTLLSNELVAPITLSSDPLVGGEEVTVSGFGVTRDGDGAIASEFLNYITVTTITNSECAETYGNYILENMVCTSGGNEPFKGGCHGDSGGPAVLNADSNPLHVGITSFVGSTGCELGNPTGFTRTASYRDWIKEKTGI